MLGGGDTAMDVAAVARRLEVDHSQDVTERPVFAAQTDATSPPWPGTT